jgi:hypothetical protein
MRDSRPIYSGCAYRLYSPTRGKAPAEHRECGGAPAIQPSTVASAASKPRGDNLDADARPHPARRVTAASSRGAPMRLSARRAAQRRNPAPERRSAHAGPAANGNHRRAMRRARAPSLPSTNARPWPAHAAPESGPDRQDGQRGWTTCKCANSHWQKWPFKRAAWLPSGKSHKTDDKAICAGDRPTNAGSASGIHCPASSPRRDKMPDPNTHTAAQAAAVAVLSCCTRCSNRSNFASDQWS